MDKREYIIEKCYECFVQGGIENTSTRDFCSAAQINSNTLYYYFKSKNDILFECINYGYSKLEYELFNVLNEFDEPSFDIFPRLTSVGLDYAPQMRFLNQAVSSPAYENHRTDQFKKVNAFYDRLGEDLAKLFGCPYEIIKNYIYEIMTLLSYYSLWGSSEMAMIQFNKIFIDFKNAITSYRQLCGLPQLPA